MQNSSKKLLLTLMLFILISGIVITTRPSMILADNTIGPTNNENSPANQAGNNLILRGLKGTTPETGYTNINQDSIKNIAAKIIQTILNLLGILFLILMIISGYQWMTAGGNEEIIGKAKKRIINSVIGIAIVILSYVISYFIMYIIYSAGA